MDEIFLVNSSSFQDFEVSASLRMGPGSVVDLTQASTITGSGAGLTEVSASYIMPDANATASWALTASWAPQNQDVSINTLTASVISASLLVTVPPPINPSDAVTKDYVDNLSQQGLDFYFRSASADFEDYYQMRRLSIPLSSSISTFVVSNVSASQYFVKFISGELNTNQIAQGRVNVRYHMWYNAGGSRTITVAPELYLSSSSGESELAIASDTSLTGDTTTQYIATITLTSSVVVATTDRLVCKFKAVSVTSSPINVTYEVEGDTSAGINVPIPSSNFVLRAGDTMTGPLTASIYGDVIGTASFATSASWAPMPTVSDSSSWASSSISSSRLNPGSMLWTVSGSNGIAPAFLAPYDYSVDNVYRPTPIREGWTHWDHKWNDWAVYDDSGARTHLGREVVIAVHNPSETSIPRLSPVYISGSQTASLNPTWSLPYKPDVYLAQADGTGVKSEVVGVARQTIAAKSDGYILCAGTMHNSNMLPYGDVGTRVWLSTDTAGGLTITKPGQPFEVVSIGYVIEAGGTGSLLVQLETEPPPANAYAGMTSIPSITDLTASQEVVVGSGSVNLYNNSSGVGAITQYPVSEVTFSIPSGYDAYFVYAETNNQSASYQLTSNFDDITGTDKVLVTTLYRADEDAHWMESKEEGLALANKLNVRLLETEKFAWESGLSLISTGSNFFTITAGQIWFGATNISQQEFNSFDTASTNPKIETHWAYHSASTWVIPIQSDGKWNSGYYDNGTDTASLAANSWSVHYVYRILGENPFDEDVFLVTSNYQYDSFASAQADTVPASIPAVLDDVAILVGRLVFQSGSTTATAESAFTNNFGQSLVTSHNSLSGIQGGQGGQYYHLTYNDYIGDGSGLMVRQYGATVSITGSLEGSSSYSERSDYAASSTSSSFASKTISSSFAAHSLTANSSDSSTSASHALVSDNADTSSYSSYAATINTQITTSWAEKAVTASFASRTITSSFAISSANADTASHATYAENTNLNVTVSYADFALSASWAPMPTVSDSSSWASSSFTSSYAVKASNADTASFATYASNTNLNVTVSYANFSLSSSWAPMPTVNDSSSWASSSFTSSYAVRSSNSDTSSYADFSLSASWAPTTLANDSSSWASASLSSSHALRSNNADTASFASYASNTNLNVTVSYADFALSASWAPGGQVGPAESASWASQSFSSSYALRSSNADTASFATYAANTNLNVTVSYANFALSASWAPGGNVDAVASSSWSSQSFSSSYSIKSSNADTASFATYASTFNTAVTVSYADFALSASHADTSSFATYASSTNTEITTSWAISASHATTASYTPLAGLVFSKGATFFDPAGIAGTASLSQSVTIWRAPFPCSASTIYTFKDGGNQNLGSASINVRKNETLNLLSSSMTITQSQVWVPATVLTVNNGFLVGDSLDIILLTSSFFPQQVAVQIDFIRL